MLRGNHECRQLTSFFNFKQECDIKYDHEIYERVMDSFDALPLACIINEKFVAVHGGISPSIDKVRDIVRFKKYFSSLI
jgi:serine/threonine-protein phosphatase 2B catalytic subunit